MNNVVDDIKIFIVEYYEILHTSSPEIKNIYADNAELHIFNKNDKELIFKSNFQNNVPLGKRKIIKYSGYSIPDQRIFVHVQSELEQPYNKMLVDEVFVCSLTSTTILINFHSIHINSLINPIEEKKEQKPAISFKAPKQRTIPGVKPKPPKTTPIEVKSINELKTAKCILVQNLPFKEKPSDFLPLLEVHGNIVKYCETKGKLLAEYDLIEDMFAARDANYEQWRGRQPKVIRCPKEVKF